MISRKWKPRDFHKTGFDAQRGKNYIIPGSQFPSVQKEKLFVYFKEKRDMVYIVAEMPSLSKVFLEKAEIRVMLN